MNDKYDINFQDMVNTVINTHGWFQGENFSDGVFIRMNEFNELHLFEFSKDKLREQDMGLLPITKGVVDQKYKKVYTQPEIMKKV